MSDLAPGVSGRYNFVYLKPYEKNIIRFREVAKKGDEILDEILEELVEDYFPKDQFENGDELATYIFHYMQSNHFLSKLPRRYDTPWSDLILSRENLWKKTKEGVLGDLYEAYVYFLHKLRGARTCKRIVKRDIITQLRKEWMEQPL